MCLAPPPEYKIIQKNLRKKKVKYGTFNKPICITVFVRTIYCTVLPGSCYSIYYLYLFISEGYFGLKPQCSGTCLFFFFWFWFLFFCMAVFILDCLQIASVFRILIYSCCLAKFLPHKCRFHLVQKVNIHRYKWSFIPWNIFQSPVWSCKARNKSNHRCAKTYRWTSILGARRHRIRKEPLCNCWQHPQLGSVGL